MTPGLGRSPGEGNGNPLQNSCLKNCVDRGAWWATVHGVSKRVRHDLVTNTLSFTAVWRSLVLNLLGHNSVFFKSCTRVEGAGCEGPREPLRAWCSAVPAACVRGVPRPLLCLRGFGGFPLEKSQPRTLVSNVLFSCLPFSDTV